MFATIENIADKSFDYVIAGGGTAGITLASRLSEDSNVTVALLEAGEANLADPLILRTVSYGAHLGNPQYDWGHATVEQEFINHKKLLWSRGKGLGGSSAINFMCYNKPSKAEMDDLERLGNTGWNWDNFLKYSQRNEKFIEPREGNVTKQNSKQWKFGKDGNLVVSFPNYIHEADVASAEAMNNAGVHDAKDPFGGDPKGRAFIPNTHDPRTHTRSYAATVHAEPMLSRPNLLVLTRANVSHVLLEKGPTGMVATGVAFLHDNVLHSIKATKDVIISAGTLKSPQILELSGIGRTDVLEKVGIPVHVDLPGVGENVQDHVSAGVSWVFKEGYEFETMEALQDEKVARKHLDLLKEDKGLFTSGICNLVYESLDTISPNATEIYEKTKKLVHELIAQGASDGYANQLKIHLQRLKPGAGGLPVEIILGPLSFSAPAPPIPGRSHFGTIPVLVCPISRGTIHITSKDPSVDPKFDPHLFEVDLDLDLLVEAVRFARQLVQHAPLSGLIDKELNPGVEMQDENELREWIKATVASTWHASSSCSMLPREHGGVVDSSLKVYGTTNLRVVDLSIMPLAVSCHTQVLAYAIAEQAADLIRSPA